MDKQKIRVLMIEDDVDYVELVRLSLAEPESGGLEFETDHADRLASGLVKLAAGRYDAVLVDLVLPDASGLEAAAAVLKACPDAPVLVSTNSGDESTALAAVRLGAQDYMIKASSDSRMLQRALRYAIERQRSLTQRDQILRSAVDGMIVIDAAGSIQFVNPAAEAVLGAPAAGLIGRPFPYSVRRGDTTLVTVARADGSLSAVEVRVAEVAWNSGPAKLAVLRDVTELRRAEKLKAEIAQRRIEDELKDKWIETLSHELRTPLTIIKGAVIDLDEGQAEPLKKQQAMLVGLARRQTERIERMVVRLLDLSRLESGRARVERRLLDAGELIARTAGDFSRAAAHRAIRLEIERAPDLPAVAADPDLLEQLTVNLMENAVRFAHSLITVSVRLSPEGCVELSVRDDGVGIPAEKKKLLFTRFSQLDRERAPGGYKGTGLGLAICKEIAGLHGGSIAAEAAPERGTVFRVRLPVGAKTAPAYGALRSAAPTSKRQEPPA